MINGIKTRVEQCLDEKLIDKTTSARDIEWFQKYLLKTTLWLLKFSVVKQSGNNNAVVIMLVLVTMSQKKSMVIKNKKTICQSFSAGKKLKQSEHD